MLPPIGFNAYLIFRRVKIQDISIKGELSAKFYTSESAISEHHPQLFLRIGLMFSRAPDCPMFFLFIAYVHLNPTPSPSALSLEERGF